MVDQLKDVLAPRAGMGNAVGSPANRLCAWTVRAFVAVSIGTDDRRWRDTVPGMFGPEIGALRRSGRDLRPCASLVGRTSMEREPTGEEVTHLDGGAG
jgi:hypothetical protein